MLAGHGRVQAAMEVDMGEVPYIRIEYMTAAEKRAYVIADNKLALNAGWDNDVLAEELKGLLATETLGFDIGVIGFEVAEMDALVEGLTPEDLATRKMTLLQTLRHRVWPLEISGSSDSTGSSAATPWMGMFWIC